MSRRTSRRNFIKASAAGGVGFWVAGGVQAAPSKSALETVNFASVGVGGKGTSDSNDAAKHGNMVAICDIDENNLNKAASKWPKAKKFFDYRKMLEEMSDSIDAVTVSTPDHSHAPASALALKTGKHCFTQKPMTHTIHEARVLGDLAKKNGLKTQMGNQGTANSTLRESAALIQGGAIGTVKEVHVWTNRPVWPQGAGRPKAEPPVPKHIHWKEFLGPAKARAYHPAYHPFKWRGWWDFGTGALGDMACHTLNMPFMALDLRDPVSVQAETSGHNQETYPSYCIIEFQFPARGSRPAVKMVWYDGGKKPPRELLPPTKLIKAPNTGSLIIGDKGTLLSPGDYGGDGNTGIFAGGEYTRQRDLKKSVEYTKSPGHFTEWVRAIKGGPESVSNFPNYSGPLTETVLLGNLAVWADGKKIDWDAKNLVATNAPEVAHIVKKEYHNGYSL
jgi:predicted dehydrogenase